VIDPRRVKVAEQAHLHLAVRPGTDVVLAWALAVELERIGGLDHAFIAEHVLGFDAFMAGCARLPARARRGDLRRAARRHPYPGALVPRCVARGHRLGQWSGAQSERRLGLRAIAALPALAGKFGVAGGGLVGGAGHAFPKTTDRLTANRLRAAQDAHDQHHRRRQAAARCEPDPPLKALFIYNHNPLIVHPDQNRLKRAWRARICSRSASKWP
jgi:anaerobic selenocysteine-containing dehydrogenase